ncbi:MAG: aminotransferase class I/II-fold pyridoxal phosphate-dependent enzyme [Lachnospiraceae bacterium]|nr:aminotransferase class I/II-fold pyridoxal phosphate-dependent enzyme [Lachnospiraceae bacterium]
MSTPNNFHGSDIETVAKIYGIEKTDIIRFAANVNPLGVSDKVKKALIENISCVNTYPERDQKELKEIIGAYAGCSPDHIYLGTGASELIGKIIGYVKPQNAVIVGPTYSEYKKNIEMFGGKATYYMTKEENLFKLDIEEFVKSLDSSIDMVILCNPNNPTSTAVDAADIDLLLEACELLDIFVMVDETYMEFHPKADLFSSAPIVKAHKNLAVIRGTSKFFAAPGLRLGYMLSSNFDLFKALDHAAAPWNLSSLAIVAGKVMFTDTDYIEATKNLIHTEQNLVYVAMKSRKSIKVFRPEANFILVKLLKENQTSKQVFDYCMERNFMIRDCSDYLGLGDKYIRFCFMRPTDDDKLVNRILDIV